ncbi:DJ-1/PfpI family protein [Serratia sp. 14-2641]|uniref:DJ-1/PfpI family protein n=1 Tax=Serratia sp. 14-2641 TaxID=1841657 RepID=UPI0008100E11|nr:DJ-1/PfpI family protein [Serratia sp. 14-2641]OCJ36808.1 hypothetical protein A6U95_03905 [Serratia sp. 14-2641]
MKKNTVLFVIISNFADWEPALLAAGLQWGYGLWQNHYAVKTVAVNNDPVLSIGGLKVIPDYTVDNVPEDFSALILVGGTSWFSPEAQKFIPMIKKALDNNIIIGAICDAARFLAVNGFINDVEHTTNALSDIKSKTGSAYTGEEKFKHQLSVHCRNIITAKATGNIEFARDIFTALNIAPKIKIDQFYEHFKNGDGNDINHK